MRFQTTVFALSASVLLFGCAATPRPTPIVSTPPTTSSTPQPVTPSIQDFTGNWQLTGTSTVQGKPPLSFAGTISQAASAVSSALHVEGSNCFNQQTTIRPTGTQTTDGLSITSTPVDGQVVTLAWKNINTIYTGTYSISGGCDDGDQGTFTGVKVNVGDAQDWDGTFTGSTQAKFSVSGAFAQNATANPDGSVGLTGTATFDTPCFNASILSPSNSFILGTTVSIQIGTNNGIVAFLGTIDPLSEFITGVYTVTGGTCDQTGTAVVALTGQWDY